jgi:hypothetical protein
MPFGRKLDASGDQMDFDSLYQEVIAPAVDAAGMEALRADEERDGGIIHKPMFERLVLCPFAVADLTLANANVFYELGVRHAVRPHTTVLLFAKGAQRLPFDVSPLRAIPYETMPGGGVSENAQLQISITERLVAARDPSADSPLYQLLEGFVPPDVARLKTDVFRERVRYNEAVKARLSAARKGAQPAAAVTAIHSELSPIGDQEAGIAIDLLLSYRDAGDTAAMVRLTEEMSPPVAISALVQEQLAFALNREGRGYEAEHVLEEVLRKHGPSSETLGLLGRILKDRWERASTEDSAAAPGLLSKAIDAYRRGFESDWRDVYPGINAVTLLELQEPGQPAVGELLPVVNYAARRRVDDRGGDYWDRATMLELAVVRRDKPNATCRLSEALAEGPAPWMRETTARNVGLVAGARFSAGEEIGWLQDIVDALLAPNV